MIKFPPVRSIEDLEAFEQSFSISFDANELRAAIFHISDAYRARASAAPAAPYSCKGASCGHSTPPVLCWVCDDCGETVEVIDGAGG